MAIELQGLSVADKAWGERKQDNASQGANSEVFNLLLAQMLPSPQQAPGPSLTAAGLEDNKTAGLKFILPQHQQNVDKQNVNIYQEMLLCNALPEKVEDGVPSGERAKVAVSGSHAGKQGEVPFASGSLAVDDPSRQENGKTGARVNLQGGNLETALSREECSESPLKIGHARENPGILTNETVLTAAREKQNSPDEEKSLPVFVRGETGRSMNSDFHNRKTTSLAVSQQETPAWRQEGMLELGSAAGLKQGLQEEGEPVGEKLLLEFSQQEGMALKQLNLLEKRKNGSAAGRSEGAVENMARSKPEAHRETGETPGQQELLFQEILAGKKAGPVSQPAKAAEEDLTEDLPRIIAAHVRNVKAGEGGKELVIQLEPKEMGRMMIRLTAKEGIVSVKIYAEHPVVKTLLEESMPGLRQSFLDQGIKYGRLDVEMGGQFFNQQQQQQQQPAWSQERYYQGHNNWIQQENYAGSKEPGSPEPGIMPWLGSVNYLA